MPNLHPSVERAFQEIDAAIFSGNEFHSAENLKHLSDYVARWQRAIPRLAELFETED